MDKQTRASIILLVLLVVSVTVQITLGIVQAGGVIPFLEAVVGYEWGVWENED